MLSDTAPPPRFAELSKILWKISKIWKRISVDQIHSGGMGKRTPLEAPGTHSSRGIILLTVLDEGT